METKASFFIFFFTHQVDQVEKTTLSYVYQIKLK